MVEEKKEVYSSIFDAASKMERKKALGKVLSEESFSGYQRGSAPLLTDEEIAQRIEKYQELHNQIADKLEQIFVKSNLSPKQLHDYFNTPQNFTSDQWNLIEQQRQTIEKMLDQLVPKQLKKKAKTDSKAPKSHQQKPKKMQVRSRWMPMH